VTAPKKKPTEKAIAKGAVGQMGLPNRVAIDVSVPTWKRVSVAELVAGTFSEAVRDKLSR
jgi:hypothetical protein